MLTAPKTVTDRLHIWHACFQGQSKHATFFSKRGVCKNSLGGDMHSHERPLVPVADVATCKIKQ